MTQRNNWHFFLARSPGGYGLKIVDDQIIFLYRETFNFPHHIPAAVLLKCFEKIDPSLFAKVKAQSLRFVFYRVVQLHLRLRSADKQIKRSVFFQLRNNIDSAAKVSIAGSLN